MSLDLCVKKEKKKFFVAETPYSITSNNDKIMYTVNVI